MSEEPDISWLKADLLAHAEGVGITVETTMTKAQILEAIESDETTETVTVEETTTVEEVSEPESVVEEAEPEPAVSKTWIAKVDRRRQPNNPELYGDLASVRTHKRFVFYTYEGEKPTLPTRVRAIVNEQ